MTETYEFQASLFLNSREVADAIAMEYLTAGGGNSEDQVREFLRVSTDAEMADEAIREWGLNNPVAAGYNEDGDIVTSPWLETRGLDRDDIVSAIARYRAQIG